MQEKGPEQVSDVSGIRRTVVLNPRPFILHNRHIRRGKSKDAGCPLCGAKVVPTYEVMEETLAEPTVDQSSGTDEDRPTPSSLDSKLAEYFGWPDSPVRGG